MSLSSDALAPQEIQDTLNQLTHQGIMRDRKDEVVELLTINEPMKSWLVESNFTCCAWFDGCYYCKDDQNNWHQVKCFA